ncbi:Aldo/keto reductase [Aspergillus leporis]|uniref:Aldo/keto reductase n=1 Tax=Aspergillus leporis TaxID=41062 RepID=A0A5N5X5M4_9EURO|nr:Aldo/keto reductase [Aspergillus leporis]
MASMQPAPKPNSRLEYPRILSPNAGLRVSPLCLGTMNSGEACRDTAFKILDYYYDNGGNFIDTANFYQEGESEQWIGEWMTSRKNRDQIGNYKKSMYVSLENSFKNMQTNYMDIFYVHWGDFTTSIEEVMQALHHLVVSGKVLYLGISDTPAWVVSSANRYARDHTLTPFSVYQGKWNVADRDVERETISMCRHEGMAFAAWAVLGQGKFKAESHDDPAEGGQRVAATLNKFAQRKDTLPTIIAFVYVLSKIPYVFPVIGGRKLEDIQGNVKALDVVLTDEELDGIDNEEDFDIGFPFNLIYEFHGTQNLLVMPATEDHTYPDWFSQRRNYGVQ